MGECPHYTVKHYGTNSKLIFFRILAYYPIEFERDDNDNNLRQLQRPNAAVTAYDDDVYFGFNFYHRIRTKLTTYI